MPNIYIGSDGIPVKQDADGAFYVTEEKTQKVKFDLEEFKEIVNGPGEES